jgi:hypothetical protein
MASADDRADEAIRVALEFAECKPTLREMIDILFVEALRIQGQERARILWGDRPNDEPDHGQIERVAKLHAVMRLLEACRDNPDGATKWLRRQASAKT